MVKSMKKILRQTFSVFEPEQYLEIISTVSDRNFMIFWQMELVCCFFFCCFFWYILFILSFGCVTIVNREMKSVSAI